MNSESTQLENLFSYGTLQTKTVQLSTFGRVLAGTPDMLVGYRIKQITVRDAVFAAKNGVIQRDVEFTGNAPDVVEGFVLSLSRHELEKADTSLRNMAESGSSYDRALRHGSIRSETNR